MSFIEIVGDNKLYGEVNIQGSKNAVLPILAATLLNKGISKINHCPRIRDVFHMVNILEQLGCKVWWEEENNIVVDATYLTTITVPDEYVKEMRSSIIIMGALVGRMHHVNISYPGGCSIGKRPIDLHLSALRKMNIQIDEEGDILHCSTTEIHGTDIYLSFPSVGATENVILAAVLSLGKTRILNAAMEPEISELCKFLVNAGAKIKGIGTDRLVIEGVSRLMNSEYSVASDRIVAGTYMAMVVGTGGEVVFRGVDSSHTQSLLDVLDAMGAVIVARKDYVSIKATNRPKACPLTLTRPYPGFPTDMQSQVMTVLAIADGTSIIVENIFEDRYHNVPQLCKLGANITVEGRTAIVKGVDQLTGCDVYARELRGGASLVIAGLIATGVTRVYNTQYIERGYEDICKDLVGLGANIKYQVN